jgi:hypothetical protein
MDTFFPRTGMNHMLGLRLSGELAISLPSIYQPSLINVSQVTHAHQSNASVLGCNLY